MRNWHAFPAGRCHLLTATTAGTAAQASEQVHDERTQDGVGRHHDRTGHARPLRRCAVILGAIARFLSGVAANIRAASLPEPAPEPFLRLRHAQTCEILSSRCERWGRLDPAQMRRLEWFMHDWREGRSMPVAPLLFRFVARLRHAAVLEGHEGEILLRSGFRTRKTNEKPRRAGMGAATNSLHLRAKAADISLPGLRQAHLATRHGGQHWAASAPIPASCMSTPTARATEPGDRVNSRTGSRLELGDPPCVPASALSRSARP